MSVKTDTTATEKAPKAPTACQCFTLEVGTENGIPVYGPCTGTTRGTFAPGHDAKLKGTLQRLFVAGHPYVVNDGSTRTEGDPMRKAAERGWEHFLTNAQDRAEQAAAKAKKAAEAAPKAAPAAAPAKKSRKTKKEAAA